MHLLTSSVVRSAIQCNSTAWPLFIQEVLTIYSEYERMNVHLKWGPSGQDIHGARSLAKPFPHLQGRHFIHSIMAFIAISFNYTTRWWLRAFI